jgi:hypothetical protein
VENSSSYGPAACGLWLHQTCAILAHSTRQKRATLCLSRCCGEQPGETARARNTPLGTENLTASNCPKYSGCDD